MTIVSFNIMMAFSLLTGVYNVLAYFFKMHNFPILKHFKLLFNKACWEKCHRNEMNVSVAYISRVGFAAFLAKKSFLPTQTL